MTTQIVLPEISYVVSKERLSATRVKLLLSRPLGDDVLVEYDPLNSDHKSRVKIIDSVESHELHYPKTLIRIPAQTFAALQEEYKHLSINLDKIAAFLADRKLLDYQLENNDKKKKTGVLPPASTLSLGSSTASDIANPLAMQNSETDSEDYVAQRANAHAKRQELLNQADSKPQKLVKQGIARSYNSYRKRMLEQLAIVVDLAPHKPSQAYQQIDMSILNLATSNQTSDKNSQKKNEENLKKMGEYAIIRTRVKLSTQKSSVLKNSVKHKNTGNGQLAKMPAGQFYDELIQTIWNKQYPEAQYKAYAEITPVTVRQEHSRTVVNTQVPLSAFLKFCIDIKNKGVWPNVMSKILVVLVPAPQFADSGHMQAYKKLIELVNCCLKEEGMESAGNLITNLQAIISKDFHEDKHHPAIFISQPPNCKDVILKANMDMWLKAHHLDPSRKQSVRETISKSIAKVVELTSLYKIKDGAAAGHDADTVLAATKAWATEIIADKVKGIADDNTLSLDDKLKALDGLYQQALESVLKERRKWSLIDRLFGVYYPLSLSKALKVIRQQAVELIKAEAQAAIAGNAETLANALKEQKKLPLLAYHRKGLVRGGFFRTAAVKEVGRQITELRKKAVAVTASV